MKPYLHNTVGKSLLLFLLCFSIFTETRAQSLLFGNGKLKWEAGFNFGPNFFLGDLGGNSGKGTNNLKDLNLQFTKMMKGVFVTVYPVSWAGLRIAADYTFLQGDDAVITTNGIDELHRKQRNLDFRSDVYEGYVAVELYPTMLFAHGEFEPRLRPYGFVGVGIFHFNPQGSLTDANGNKTWYNLQPLRTEGEGMAEYPNSKPYQLTQMNIPLGAGLKYYASDRINISMELLYRKTFTDYIDDVSKNYIDPNNFIKYMPADQAAIASKISDKVIPILFPGMTRFPDGTMRGDTKNGDTYFSIVAKIGFRLGPIYESAFARRAARETKCPRVY
jgi:hypothetical protein